MQLHQLKPIHKPKKKKRVGHGDKFAGKGRGTRGQKPRAGRKLKPIIRELIKRYPKLRGYKFKAQKENLTAINLEILEEKFKASDRINPQILLDSKLISKIKGKTPKVKILGKGKITKPLTIEDCMVSKNAREKIEKAGGQII